MLERAGDPEALNGPVWIFDERNAPEFIEREQPAVEGVEHERCRASVAGFVVVIQGGAKARDVLEEEVGAQPLAGHLRPEPSGAAGRTAAIRFSSLPPTRCHPGPGTR